MDWSKKSRLASLRHRRDPTLGKKSGARPPPALRCHLPLLCGLQFPGHSSLPPSLSPLNNPQTSFVQTAARWPSRCPPSRLKR